MDNQNRPEIASGQFTGHDKLGTPVILEWKKTTLFSPEFAEAMKTVWPLAEQAYTPVEMQFLRAHPEVVSSEEYFKPFEPLFKNGLSSVDWNKTEQTMRELLKSHFVFDASTFGSKITQIYAKDICYYVTVKDPQTNTLLGFITFMARTDYAPGDIKIMALAVGKAHQNHGLGKLLVSSILKIAPEIKRIFLCTRVTNDTALKTYRAWGFTKDASPILDHAFNLEHWVFLEYKTEMSNILQEAAKTLDVAQASLKATPGTTKNLIKLK